MLRRVLRRGLQRALGRALGLAAIGIFGLACSDSGTTGDDPGWLVRVTGEALSPEQFQAEYDRLPAALQQRYAEGEGRQAFIDQLVGRQLLVQEARRRGFAEEPKLVAQVAEFEERLLVDALQRAVSGEAVSQEDLRRYYDTHRSEYSDEQATLRHILVREAEQAEALRAELEAGGDFIALAREHSIDPTAQRGGDLGAVRRGRMDPAFDQAAFALAQPGDLSPVVRTRFGFHIIQLVERPAVRTRPFEQVELSIRQKLQRQALDTFQAELRDAATVEQPGDAGPG